MVIKKMALMMEADRTCETLLNECRTARLYNPKYSRVSFKSYICRLIKRVILILAKYVCIYVYMQIYMGWGLNTTN